jgi:hypothetical protein
MFAGIDEFGEAPFRQCGGLRSGDAESVETLFARKILQRSFQRSRVGQKSRLA